MGLDNIRQAAPPGNRVIAMELQKAQQTVMVQQAKMEQMQKLLDGAMAKKLRKAQQTVMVQQAKMDQMQKQVDELTKPRSKQHLATISTAPPPQANHTALKEVVPSETATE